MPFVDLAADVSALEGVSDDPEAIRELTHVSKGLPRSRLVAVAILADMAKQGRTLAVVTRPYAYIHPVYGQDVTVEVPKGFVTDFASIPRIFHFIVHPFGSHAPAAVLHDYLYAVGQKKCRALADKLFLNAMKEAGVPGFRRSVMFRMVRTFGGGGYGLESDWKFVDAETGEDIEAPYACCDSPWAPEKPKRGRKNRKAAPSAEETPANGAA
jgi:hypothetical protein